MTNPKVSVIVPAYNSEKHLEQCINSILTQNIENIEVVIINDCSQDNTQKVIEELTEKDSRIKPLIHKQNKGRCGALNTGIKNANGEYIAFLDSDDIMVQNRLKLESDFLDSNQNIDLVYGDMLAFTEDTNEIARKKALDLEEDAKEILLKAKESDVKDLSPAQILHPTEYIPGGTVMVRKKVFDAGIMLDEKLRNSEDYDLWFQIIGKGFKIKKLELDGFIYRKHSNQKSANPEKMKIAADHIINKLKQGEYFNN